MPVQLAPLVTLAGFACWLLLATSSFWLGVSNFPTVPTASIDQAPSQPDPLLSAAAQVQTTLAEHQASLTAHEQLLRDIAVNVNALKDQRGELAERLDDIDRQLTDAARDRDFQESQPPEIAPPQPTPELMETRADIARVAREIDQLRGDLRALSQQLIEREPPPAVAPELLTTKLYRPQQLRASQLEPLLVPLLTPETGVWGSAPLPGDETDAILVRDYPDVMAKIDRLIAELDRPLPGLEFDVFLQQVDRTTGLPRSLAIPVRSDLFGNDGASLLVPESVLTESTTIQADSSPNSSAKVEESEVGTMRVLRITPRLVR